MATYWGRRNGRHGPCASTATTVPGRVPPAWRHRGRTSRRGTGAGAVEHALIQQVPVTLLLRLAPVLVRLRICVAGILVVGPATAGCLGLGSTRRGNRPIRGRRCTGCGNGRARFHRHGGLRRVGWAECTFDGQGRGGVAWVRAAGAGASGTTDFAGGTCAGTVTLGRAAPPRPEIRPCRRVPDVARPAMSLALRCRPCGRAPSVVFLRCWQCLPWQVTRA
jgi:hypothetical protein